MALAPGQRDKLVRVLGMLGSEHMGERAAAALAADKLLRSVGVTWAEVIGEQPVSSGYGFSASPVPDYVSDLQACGRRSDLLTKWEVTFVTGLAQQKTPASRRQRDLLAGIAAKVRAAGPRNA